MKQRQKESTILPENLSMNTRRRVIITHQSLNRGSPQWNDNPWIYDSNLRLKVQANTSLNLGRPRRPIVRRPTLDDVCDEHGRSIQPNRRQEFGEKLSCRANERTTGQILLSPGTFTDEHDPSICRSLTGHSYLSFLVQITFCTDPHFGANSIQFS